MRISHRFRLLFAVALVALPGTALAAFGNLAPTFSGSYLAGRSADQARDIGAAVRFYSAALTADPDNPSLTERLLLLSLANNDMDQSFGLASRLIGVDASNPAGAPVARGTGAEAGQERRGIRHHLEDRAGRTCHPHLRPDPGVGAVRRRQD